MAALTCYAKACSYNDDCKCCKGDIMVGGRHAECSKDTCCDSFRDHVSDRFSNSLDHPCQTISIDCEATNCVYNTNYRCFAQVVKIEGSDAVRRGETACATFSER